MILALYALLIFGIGLFVHVFRKNIGKLVISISSFVIIVPVVAAAETNGGIFSVVLNYWWLLILIIGGVVFAIAAALRTIVPPDKIDIVVRSGRSDIFCSNTEYMLEGEDIRSVYYKIPSWMPSIGLYVRRMLLQMLEIKVPDFVAFDKNRARFSCDIVAFVAIKDGKKAAMRMPSTADAMSRQIQQVLWATMRDSTTKMTVRTIINNRSEVIDMIREPLTEALDEWGLGLKDIEIVEFKDGPDSKVVSDISSIREQEIDTEARQKNADQVKKAKIVEAETMEEYRKREIQRDEEVAMREQQKLQEVAKEEKIAKEQALEVSRVEQVKQEKIDKEQAEVLAERQKEVARIDAEKQKEVETIIKEQKHLEGQGDRLRQEEQAKGEAAPIREKGKADADVIQVKGNAQADIKRKILVAEADGKDKLQAALNKFGREAIIALTAIREIEKNEAIGVALGKSVGLADTKVFLGGGDGDSAHDAFGFGKSMEALNIGNTAAAASILNRFAQPNDLGFSKLEFAKMLAVIEKTPEIKQQIRDAMEQGDVKTTESMISKITGGMDDMHKDAFDMVDDNLEKQTKKPKKRKQRKLP